MNVAARRSSSRNSSNLNGASVLLDVALRLLIGAEGDNDIASNFLLNFLFAKAEEPYFVFQFKELRCP